MKSIGREIVGISMIFDLTEHRLAWQMGNGDEDEREANSAVLRRQAPHQTAVHLEQEDDLDLDCDSGNMV